MHWKIVGSEHEDLWGKVKLSLYRPWRPLGLREVEAPTFLYIRLTDGGKVVSPTLRPPLPAGRFLLLISVRGWVDPRSIVPLEGLGKFKKSTSSGTRTGDLPACSIVPQPTTLPHAPEPRGGWRNLRNEELHNFYSSLNITRVLKSMLMRQVVYVARMGGKVKLSLCLSN
jgi:hypothetical protein